ncbi:2OG-Fe(II) oxygenase [Salipaludibacillus keqinensis]|uniref:2OG-Fe(II) oxygenase n=2 Tax=Salipaludibacillus keqinensis TaxID=2045207 RepID=A0A323TQF2_9BACI|nr:2OG-Fe(II) oxygenase [Salipaludibacillus keqinensis]PYZ94723.1 2OG-Fe(II) oxygenase [Salipaludibacillus keqinensis]
MNVDSKDMTSKEQTIFHHVGNKIVTEDREINIVARVEEPLIVVLGNVLSDEECDELISLSKDRMKRSKVGSSRNENDLRTSTSMFLEESENEVVMRIEKRLSQIMNIPFEHGEDLLILNYKIGQEYKAHFDFFSSKNHSVDNPRISTLVMYLNDVEEGGETFFPELGFSVSPQKGMAVYFEYFYNNQDLNELTLHGGAPIIKGDKWAATKWMRRKRVK